MLYPNCPIRDYCQSDDNMVRFVRDTRCNGKFYVFCPAFIERKRQLREENKGIGKLENMEG